MDGEPPQFQLCTILLQTQFQAVGSEVYLALFVVILLLIASALMSASEIAFFSLTNYEIADFSKSEDEQEKLVASIMKKPRYLLSTILVTNNIVNIGVVIFTHYIISVLIHFEPLEVFGFVLSKDAQELLLNVIIDTFVLVLFAEAIPKVYATQNKLKYAKAIAPTINRLNKILKPINYLLVGSTQTIESSLKKRNVEMDRDEINKAIDLTVNPKDSSQNARLLKGIVHFGNLNVKQVMRPRMEIAAVNTALNFSELMKNVQEYGYSRIPVFKDDMDNISGILHVKDLISHLNQDENYNWRKLVREALFVPENKKIDDLLREFQESRKHLAIVVDEYGGTAGIITLEDVMEQVVGEIKDEFDEVGDVVYKQLDDKNYIFEGKTLLLDMSRVLNMDTEIFEESRGEAETIAGLIIEVLGRIPKSGEEAVIENFVLRVLSLKSNRIEKVKVTIP